MTVKTYSIQAVEEMQAENERLREENGSLAEYHANSVKERVRLNMENKQLRERVGVLESALEKYGSHYMGCAWFTYIESMGQHMPCTCGLSEALKDDSK